VDEIKRQIVMKSKKFRVTK